MTGEPIREVSFELPPGSLHMLKQVEGFSDFNPMTEVRHCDKPGAGLADAPRCVSMNVVNVTRGKCNLLPSSSDP